MADVIISNKIPDAYVSTVLDNSATLGGAAIHVVWKESEVFIDIPVRGAEEPSKAYVERVNKRIFWKIMQLVDLNEKNDARNAAIDAIPQAVSDIPEDVME